MYELMLLIVIICIAITAVSVVRWREAEAKLKVLKSMSDSGDTDFDITKHCTPDGMVTQCTVTIHKRRGIPIVSDLTGISLKMLADEFDEAEKSGKPCVIQTKEFKA